MASPRRLLAALTLAWAVVWVERAALSPVGSAVQAELGLGYGALGLLPALGLLAGAGGYLGAGLASPRSPRLVLLAGALLLALATLASAAAPGYASLALAQALAGAGEGLFYVPALALVACAAEPRRAGRALGTLDSGISVGAFAVLLAAPPLLALAGWRGVFLAAGALGLALVPLLAVSARGAALPALQPGAARAVLGRAAWPLYGAVALLLAVYFALLFLAPAFLVARGFALADADTLGALAVLLGVPWHFAGGALADRLGAARSVTGFTGLFALGLAGLGLATEPGALALLLVATYGVGIAGVVALIALVPRVLGRGLAVPGFGVFWGLGYLAGAAGPFLVGALADAGGFGPALLAAAGLAGAAALLPLALRRAERGARG